MIDIIDKALASLIDAEKSLESLIEEHIDIGHIIYGIQNLEDRLNKVKRDLQSRNQNL